MARFLDKTQDAQAVVRLVDQFQKTILIYQVCPGSCQARARLTRVVKGLTAAIDPQPDRAIDSGFLRVVFAFYSDRLPIDSSLRLAHFWDLAR